MIEYINWWDYLLDALGGFLTLAIMIALWDNPIKLRPK